VKLGFQCSCIDAFDLVARHTFSPRIRDTYDAGGAILLLPKPAPRLALTSQCDFHGLLLEGVDVRVAIKPATPRRFPLVNPSSFTQAGLMFERCT